MKAELYVELMEHTPNPERLVAAAAKLCYSPKRVRELYADLTREKARDFIERLMQMGHDSPIEHANYTFGIEGISRTCSHQLVRHRLASYSQQSQRYVGELNDGEDTFDFIVPQSVKEVGLEKRFEEMMREIQTFYNELAEGLEKSGLKGEDVFQDARYVLPNATATQLMMTLNARELLHFFQLRTCNRAQWEIRRLAKRIYQLVLPTAPTLFKYAGPRCVTDNKCREGKKSCGLASSVREEFQRLREE